MYMYVYVYVYVYVHVYVCVYVYVHVYVYVYLYVYVYVYAYAKNTPKWSRTCPESYANTINDRRCGSPRAELGPEMVPNGKFRPKL